MKNLPIKWEYNSKVVIIFIFPDRVKDDYLANRILRDKMRAKRKSAQATAASDNALLSKSCLPSGIEKIYLMRFLGAYLVVLFHNLTELDV